MSTLVWSCEWFMSDWTEKHSVLSTKVTQWQKEPSTINLEPRTYSIVEYLSSFLGRQFKPLWTCGVKSQHKAEKLKQHYAVWHPTGRYKLISFSKHLQRVTSSTCFSVTKISCSCSHGKRSVLLRLAYMSQVLCVELLSRQFYWEPKSNQCQMPFTKR